MNPFTISFADLGLRDEATAGGKGANLGELYQARFAVPPGFVVTTTTFSAAVAQSGISVRLHALLDEIDPSDPSGLGRVADRLRSLVRELQVPLELTRAVRAAYEGLGEDVPVAVRSSAAGEESTSSSFAGMNRRFMPVVGARDVLARLVDCWASVYGARVIAYRQLMGSVDEPAIAVVVQRWVSSCCSGVMLTQDPAEDGSRHLVIEASAGPGEAVVGGRVTPDTFVVDRTSLAVRSVRLGTRHEGSLSGPRGGGAARDHAGGTPVLDDDQLAEIAQTGLLIEQHYGTPQDVEWTLDPSQRLWIVRSRPITLRRQADPHQ